RMLKAMVVLKKGRRVKWEVDIRAIKYGGEGIGGLVVEEERVRRGGVGYGRVVCGDVEGVLWVVWVNVL
uniref:hypothetical protein n=1 Tax=Geobacillus sp. (strain Y412MC10) TaxID=481743 RepID=UPI001C92D59F